MAVTRLGLYGGPRAPYGSFAGKVEGEVVVKAALAGHIGRRKPKYVIEVEGELIQVENIAHAEAVFALNESLL